jgi:hypothetical protein
MSWPRVTVEFIKAAARYSLVGGPFGSELTTSDYVEEGVLVPGALPAQTRGVRGNGGRFR